MELCMLTLTREVQFRKEPASTWMLFGSVRLMMLLLLANTASSRAITVTTVPSVAFACRGRVMEVWLPLYWMIVPSGRTT